MDILDNSLKIRAYEFGLATIKLCDTLPQKRSAWVITDQLIRSATSVGANLIEAKASSSRLEFKKFNEIALKSANESIYWLMLLKDSGLVQDVREVGKLIKEVEELCSMIATGVKKLKNK
jgi:four helix bundle protein